MSSVATESPTRAMGGGRETSEDWFSRLSEHPAILILRKHRSFFYFPAGAFLGLAILLADMVLLVAGWLLMPIPLALYYIFERRKKIALTKNLHFRAEGKWYVGITLAVGFAAMNTGTNLLYLILGMLLSLIIVSGLLSDRSYRRLDIRRRLPVGPIHAGETFWVSIDLENRKAIVPAVSLKISELAEDDLECRDPCAFVLKVGPKETAHSGYEARFARRGAKLWKQLRIASGFPFGLFEKIMTLDVETQGIVFPRRRKLAARMVETLTARRPNERGLSKTVGRGLEFRGVREYRQGDEPKHIHWRSSARLGVLRTRIYEGASSARVAIVLENHISEFRRPNNPAGDFEGGREREPRAEPCLDRLAEAAQAFFLHGFEAQMAPVLICRAGSLERPEDVQNFLALMKGEAEPLSTDTLLSSPALLDAQVWVLLGAGACLRALSRALSEHSRDRPFLALDFSSSETEDQVFADTLEARGP